MRKIYNAANDAAEQNAIIASEKAYLESLKDKPVKASDKDYPSPFASIANWLWDKGYQDLFDTNFPWRMVFDRLEVAQPIATKAATAFATYLNGSVVNNEEKAFSQPYIMVNEDAISLYDCVKLVDIQQNDSTETVEAKTMLKSLWQEWIDLTIPSVKRVVQFNLFPELSGKELALKAFSLSTKQVNDMKAQNTKEFFRSYSVALDKNDYKLAYLASKTQSKEAKEFEEALENMDNSARERHLIAEAIDNLARVANKGFEYTSLAFNNGIPVAPTEEELMLAAESALESTVNPVTGMKWSWDYVLQFYSYLLENNHIDTGLAAEWTGLHQLLIEKKYNPGQLEYIEAFAIKEALDLQSNCNNCGFWKKSFLTINIAGVVAKASSIGHAMALKAAEAIGVFKNKDTLKTALESPAFAKACASKLNPKTAEGIRFTIHEFEYLKEFIKAAFTEDAIATLDDGEIKYVTKHNYSLGPGKNANSIDKHYGMNASGEGDNLYGKALMAVRDEIRAKIDARKV